MPPHKAGFGSNLGEVDVKGSMTLNSGSYSYSSFAINSPGSVTLNSGATFSSDTALEVNSGGKLYAKKDSMPNKVSVNSGGYASYSSVSWHSTGTLTVQKSGEASVNATRLNRLDVYGNAEIKGASNIDFVNVSNGGAAHITSGNNTIGETRVANTNSSSITSSTTSSLYVYQDTDTTIKRAYVYPYGKIKMNANSITRFTEVLTLYGTPQRSGCSSKNETTLGNLCAYDKYSGASHSTRAYLKGELAEKGRRMYHINCGAIIGTDDFHWNTNTENNRNGWAGYGFHTGNNACDGDRLNKKSWSYSTLKTYGG